MLDIGLNHFLVVSVLVFVCGFFTVLTRRNAIGVLMGVELILNAANLNFVAFARFGDYGIDGQMFALFIIILATAEAAIMLAITKCMFDQFGAIDMTRTDSLRD